LYAQEIHAEVQWRIGLARKAVKENNLNINIFSAGIYALKGEHASYNSVAVMKEYDVDIVTHTATPIEEIDINNMDIILCATNNHKRQLINQYPSASKKVYTFKEYAELDNNGEDIDIKDPWGNDMNTFRMCAAEISYCIDKIMKKIQNNTRKED
jgi:protein-tyrosine-phosphatase